MAFSFIHPLTPSHFPTTQAQHDTTTASTDSSCPTHAALPPSLPPSPLAGRNVERSEAKYPPVEPAPCKEGGREGGREGRKV